MSRSVYEHFYFRLYYYFFLLFQWNLVCDRKWLIGLVGTITMAGFTLGSITGGYAADRYAGIPLMVLFHIQFIIVVIIMWTSEKLSQRNKSDITVIWVSDWFKWQIQNDIKCFPNHY